MPDFVRRLYRSQRDQAAATPPALSLAASRLCFGARKQKAWFDPCPSVRPKGWDGLVGKWRKFNFVNPPWNQGADWVNKAAIETQEHGACSVLFPPPRGLPFGK